MFDDSERETVGTLYKKKGKNAAVLEGLRIVGPKLSEFVQSANRLVAGAPVGIYCWRGGQRSESIGWLLDKGGIEHVAVLESGYKAFRHHVLESFTRPLPFIVLGGYTGTGKTEILKALSDAGEQILDLEGLANHKGSAFGALGQDPQPRTEQFENLLWERLRHLDTNRPIWIEDESRHIGSCRLPDPIYDSIRAAQVLFLDLPVEHRVERLTHEYGIFSQDELREPLERIKTRLGGQHLQAATKALEIGDMEEVARITLRYYDKAYRFGLEQRSASMISRVDVPNFDLREILSICREHVRVTQ
jgi:tRNA 2-selenouridine synthase